MQAFGSFVRSCSIALSRPSGRNAHFFIANKHLPNGNWQNASTLQRRSLCALKNCSTPSTRIFGITSVPSRFNHSSRTFATFAGKSIQPRFFSSNSTFEAAAARAQDVPVLASPAVGRWLLLCSVLVYGVIVVGGVTRLTESGLSITEWRPITGILPPLGEEEWEAEFTKYKATPEFKL